MKRAALLLLALALGSGPLAAADHVGLAGSEVSGLGSYTYVGIISPLGNGTLGDGLVMRHWLEYLTYEYETGGRDVDAERFGYAPALGYQTRLWGGYAGFYGGLAWPTRTSIPTTATTRTRAIRRASSCRRMR